MEEEFQLEKTDLACPICGKPLYLTKTKRTFAWKCLEGCKQFDSNKISDIFSHRRRELEAIPYLKKIAPHLTFVENVSYGWDILMGEEKESKELKQRMVYDFKIYWGGYKLERVKVSVVQNCTLDHYLEAEEQYLQGRRETLEKLAKMDALFIFYFPDEPDESKKIAVSRAKDLLEHAVEVKDRFGNIQYSLPVSIRRFLIFVEQDKISELLHRKLPEKIMERRYIT